MTNFKPRCSLCGSEMFRPHNMSSFLCNNENCQNTVDQHEYHACLSAIEEDTKVLFNHELHCLRETVKVMNKALGISPDKWIRCPSCLSIMKRVTGQGIMLSCADADCDEAITEVEFKTIMDIVRGGYTPEKFKTELETLRANG